MIRAFEAGDLDMINGWLQVRGLSTLPISIIPPIGFIVPDTACGFLYRADAGLAFGHNFVTNPAAPGRQRYEGLVSVREAIVAAARVTGVTHLLGWSNNETALRLATERGARIVDTGISLHVALLEPRGT